MEYNRNIKNMADVKAEYPVLFNSYTDLYYVSMVEKFKKEVLSDLLRDAKRKKEKITEEKRKQLEEIAEAKAVYRFCWGWDQIFYNMQAHHRPAKNSVFLIRDMLKAKKDPWACDSVTVTDFMNKRARRNPGWGMCTDRECLRDIDYND